VHETIEAKGAHRLFLQIARGGISLFLFVIERHRFFDLLTISDTNWNTIMDL